MIGRTENEPTRHRCGETMRARNCFVLMPFSNAFNDVFATISKALDDLGLVCWRADQITEPGNVVVRILDDIKKADIIIADLTGRNPNVFYETGRAHELKAGESNSSGSKRRRCAF